MIQKEGMSYTSPPSNGIAIKLPTISPSPSEDECVHIDSGLNVGICSQQGKRPYQEDEYALRPFLTIGSNNGNGQSYMESRNGHVVSATHFIGLFDGHAGGRCSKHISSILPDVLTEDSLFMTNLPLALKRSFHTANDIFLKIAEQQRLHDGSTGITALLRNGKLLVGNVGDCRALLLSAGKTIQMSIDQKPTNPDEQRRIASLGGVITNNLGVTRVNGVLAVSRAFGNRKLRKVIRPDVEMMQRELTREDDFLVMASDGLWDVLRNKDVCDMCYGLAATHRPQQIAEELVQTALGRGSMDNVTCIVVRLTDYINRSLMKENTYDPRSENQANATTVLPNNVTPKSLTPTSVSRSPSQSPHTVVQQETSVQANPPQATKTPLFHRIGRNDSGDGFEMFETTIQSHGQQQQTINAGGLYVTTKAVNGIQRGTSAKHRPGGPSGSNVMGNRMANSSALPGGNVRRTTTANPMSISPSMGIMNGQGTVTSNSVSPGGITTRPWTTTSPATAAAAAASGLLPVSSQPPTGKMVVSPSPSPSPSQLFMPLPTGLSLSGNSIRNSNREDMRISRDSRDEADNMSILMRPAPIPAGEMPKSASLRPQQSPTVASLGLFVTPDPRSGFVSPKDINLSRVFDKANGRASSASAASLRAHQRDQQQPIGLPGNSPHVTKLTTIARSASHDSSNDNSSKLTTVVNRTDSPSMHVENDSIHNNSIPPGRTHSLEDLYALSGTGAQQQGGVTRPLNSPIAMLTAAAAATTIDKIGLGTPNNVLTDVNFRRTGPRRTALMSRTYS